MYRRIVNSVCVLSYRFVFFQIHRGRSSKPIFVQIAKQVVNLNPTELRLPSRAWKVKLVGEGADDAGGVFDDTITEMCQVSCHLSVFDHNMNYHNVHDACLIICSKVNILEPYTPNAFGTGCLGGGMNRSFFYSGTYSGAAVRRSCRVLCGKGKVRARLLH